jgi:hypothetical protein
MGGLFVILECAVAVSKLREWDVKGGAEGA